MPDWVDKVKNLIDISGDYSLFYKGFIKVILKKLSRRIPDRKISSIRGLAFSLHDAERSIRPQKKFICTKPNKK